MRLSHANLSNAYLTILPTDWRPRDHAQKWFNADWCKREGLGSTCKGISPDQTAEQLDEWKVHRQTYLDTLSRPNLEGRDLRYANMENAFLPNVDLSEARMDRAVLVGVRMEGADLSRAQMEKANLRQAQMEGANLHGAQMKGATLISAQMKGADFSWAWMEGDADFRWARMEGVNLSGRR